MLFCSRIPADGAHVTKIQRQLLLCSVVCIRFHGDVAVATPCLNHAPHDPIYHSRFFFPSSTSSSSSFSSSFRFLVENPTNYLTSICSSPSSHPHSPPHPSIHINSINQSSKLGWNRYETFPSLLPPPPPRPSLHLAPVPPAAGARWL